ncbi:MFS transporter [Halobacteriales archaeon Cl-PHB]
MQLLSKAERRRWIVWAVLAASFLLVNVYRLSTAVLAEDLMQAYGTTGAALGTLHAAFFYIYAPMQLVAGVLSDRLGIRRTAAGGTLVMSLGGIAFALAESYLVAFLARALVGLGGGVMFIATLRFCANWFRTREFATMSGLTVAVVGLGGVMASTPLSVAVTAVGLRTTLLGLGVFGLGLTAVIASITHETPVDAGLEPISGVPTVEAISLRDVLRNLRTVLGERATWLAGAAQFFSNGVNITIIGLWGIPFVVQMYDVSVTAASVYTLVGSAGLVVGPPAIGHLSDRLGTRTPLIVAGAAVHTAMFAFLAVTGTPPVALVGLVFFTTSFVAGGFTLAFPVIESRHDETASGVATGTVNMLGFFGAAVFPMAMGYILDVYWTGSTVASARVYTLTGYRVMFGLGALAGLAALVASVGLYYRHDSAAHR